MRVPELTVELLKSEAKAFADIESSHDEPTLFGVTDGKAVGTYFEQVPGLPPQEVRVRGGLLGQGY